MKACIVSMSLQLESVSYSICSKPSLLRFHGNPNYTIKARFWQLLGHELPFDRHDWYVNRCGREVKYIIDFYSVKGDESAMMVDCRPAVTFSGIADRMHLAVKKWISWK